MFHFIWKLIVSWDSNIQESLVLFLVEVEYDVVSSFCAQVIWIKMHLSDYGVNLKIVRIKCDNNSVINNTKNSLIHSLIKYIKIRHHYIREHVKKWDCIIELCLHLINWRIFFTKLIPKEILLSIRVELRIMNQTY